VQGQNKIFGGAGVKKWGSWSKRSMPFHEAQADELAAERTIFSIRKWLKNLGPTFLTRFRVFVFCFYLRFRFTKPLLPLQRNAVVRYVGGYFFIAFVAAK